MPAIPKLPSDAFLKLGKLWPLLHEFQDSEINTSSYLAVYSLLVIVEVDAWLVSKQSSRVTVGSAGDNDFEAPLGMLGETTNV